MPEQDAWRRLADLAPSMMAYWGSDLRCQAANQAYARWFGTQPAALLGRSMVDVIGQALFELNQPHIRAVLRGEPQQFERLIAGPNGAERQTLTQYMPDLGPGGEVLGFVAELTEVPSLKAAQVLAAERQAAADERFRRVVEDSPNGVLMVDRTQTIVLVNGMVEQIFGYDRSELLGQRIEQLIPSRFRADHQVKVTQFHAGPNSRPMGSNIVGRRRDGSEVPVEVQLTPVEMVDGKFVVASIVDISARRVAETELRRSNADLEQFASIASHDLQEPLRMVASYTELLAKRYQGKLDEKADKYIFYANDGAKRMQQLVKDLLSYSRVGSQGRALQPVSADDVAQRVAQMLREPLAQVNATLEIKPLPKVMADEGQLYQLFQNLIGNALKFRGDQAPVITIEAVLEHDRWRFGVRDNGIGIELQYSERIFQMFQRLHERGRYEGSGIGLAIVKRIVERHGGKVWFESTFGVGTTFYFTLMPANDASATS